jgi:general secretion pathway protein G
MTSPYNFCLTKEPLHMVSTDSRHARISLVRTRPARGFTLIELLVVLAILTLLAGLVGPRVLNQLGGAKSKTTAVQIADLDKSLELFKLDVGRYPSSEEGLDALVKRPGNVNGWTGPYLKGGVPTDPWGRAYRYANPGPNGGIEILSLGADGAPGGDGENADIRNTP